ATPADRGAANINYERKPLAVPGTWNPGTNYADSRYQLPQIDTEQASSKQTADKASWQEPPPLLNLPVSHTDVI
ncbi:hypothetical protein ACL1FV_12770, partial [Corynebacterium striatum]